MRRALSPLPLLGCALACVIAPGRAAASPDGFPEALYGSWVVRSSAGPDSDAVARTPSLRVRFRSEHSTARVSVSGGCNGMGGEGSLDGGFVSFAPLIHTMMACEEPLMRADQFVSLVLEGPARLETRTDPEAVWSSTPANAR